MPLILRYELFTTAHSWSAASGAICLDTWAMKDATVRPELFTAGRLHPNADGHRMLAAAFADLLLRAKSAA